MVRFVGIAMILLGASGVGVSLLDWQTLESVLPSNIKAPIASNDDADADAGEDVAGDIALSKDQEALPAGRDSLSDAAAVASRKNDEPSDASVTSSDAANVQLFERDARPDASAPLPWADIESTSDKIDEGTGHASFLVTLSEPADRPIILIFSTIDLSAQDDEDYRAQRGTLTFKPGVVSAEIKTPLIDNDVPEEDEQFAVVLNGAPDVVQFRSRRATATIRDDD